MNAYDILHLQFPMAPLTEREWASHPECQCGPNGEPPFISELTTSEAVHIVVVADANGVEITGWEYDRSVGFEEIGFCWVREGDYAANLAAARSLTLAQATDAKWLTANGYFSC